MRRFELIEGKSSKFWEAEQAGSDLKVRWGRIGAEGQSQTKSFGDDAKAAAALAKLITEKTGKGYKEITPSGTSGASAQATATPGVPTASAPAASASATSAPATPAPAPSAPASVKTAPAATRTPATASASAATTSAPQAPAETPKASPASNAASPAESLDAQCERAFVATLTRIAEGEIKPGGKLSAATLKRDHGISEHGASMALEQLKSRGLLKSWGTIEVQEKAPDIARELLSRRAAAQTSSPPTPAGTGGSPASTPADALNSPAAGPAGAAAPDGVPPWLAQGEPVRPLNTGRAYATRRHPQPLAALDAKALWIKVRTTQDSVSFDLTATDAALRPATQRMIDRLGKPGFGEDAEADGLLLAFACSWQHHASGPLIVDYLVAQYGLPGAVEIYLSARRINVDFKYQRDTGQRAHFSLAVEGSDSYGQVTPAEITLRGHLAAAPEEVWQRCADRIEAALPSLHPARQPTAAFMLPDRPELSNALALRLKNEPDVPEALHWLLMTATDPAATAAAARGRPPYHNLWDDANMVATLLTERGMHAIGILERGAEHERAGDALAAIGTPEAVTALARVASSSKGALARLALAVDRWPLAAIVALSRLAAADGKDAGLFKHHLTALLRSQGDGMIDVLRPWLDGAARALIDQQRTLLAGPAEEAREEDLPGILASPPWQARTQKKTADVLTLAPLPLDAVEQWPPSERESALKLHSWQKSRHDDARTSTSALLDLLGFEIRSVYQFRVKGQLAEAQAAMDDFRKQATAAIQNQDAGELILVWQRMWKLQQQAYHPFYSSGATLLPAAMGVAFWNAVAGEPSYLHDQDFVMASFGLAALPGLVSIVQSRPTENFALAQHFGAVELAPMAARAFAKLKSLREAGQAWLLKFPQHAACGLIGAALGKATEARDSARSALRLLAAQGHEALLREVAQRYERENVMSSLQAVLAEDPRDWFPAKIAPLPTWWQPQAWHRPVLAGTTPGKALPDAALTVFGQMLSFPTHEGVYAGIADVKAVCTPESLAGFGWDLFNAWMMAGSPSKEGWALTSLALIGNDEVARKLTPLIRAWPGESAHARAVTGLDVLAGIGSDVALMLLNGVAQKVKFKGLQDKAREKIDAIAQARGLTTEELEDRLAPDLGLDERGTLTLDFGPRSFMVGFDETLKPYVREVDAQGSPGTRLPDLPKPKKTDDASKAKEATDRFKLLKKDAKTIASQQLLRLEVAMCTRRRWAPELFRTFLVEHPLVRHLVHRLIWGVYEAPAGQSHGGTLKTCFRVAEDGGFTTAQDDPFDLPAGENLLIGVPHALELPQADAAAFGQMFADYELLQPFAQIGRDTYELSPEERQADKLMRWAGVKVPTGRVLGLVNKGWRRGQAQDGGGIWYFIKPLDDRTLIELHLDPGIIVGMVDEYPEQTLGEIQVGKPSAWGSLQEGEVLSRLDAIAASELIRDMEALRA